VISDEVKPYYIKIIAGTSSNFGARLVKIPVKYKKEDKKN
jgi:hypothetical protein